MSKKILNLAIIFLVLSLISGVFYREFTKYFAYTSYTTLSVVHTHLFVLGTMFLMILYLITKSSNIDISRALKVYAIGLFITNVSMLINGVFDVITKSTYSNIILVCFSGIGHLMLGVGLIWIMYTIKMKLN